MRFSILALATVLLTANCPAGEPASKPATPSSTRPAIVPKTLSPQALGAEYSSENTKQLTSAAEISGLLDQMGKISELT